MADDLFEQVQQKVYDRRQAPGRNTAKVEYLLSPFLYCGSCGRQMNGFCGTGKSGKKYHYYKCGARIKNSKSCDNNAPRKHELESFVMDKIFEFLTDEI